ncbi:MAG: NUDIX hydrolase [Phycisphaerales bacterium]|nr:NUDIX hydrolase [Phycisphaerales bacterium]
MSADSEKPLGRELGWQVHKSESIYDSQWFSVRSDQVSFPNDQRGTYTYVEHPGSALVVPVLNDGRIVLIRSYRYTLDAYCWEIPAGRIEPGQTPEQCARAELQEEIGAHTKSLEHLTTLHIANGFACCPCHFYLATNVTLEGNTQHESGETIISIEAVSLNEAISRLTKPSSIGNNLGDADSTLALLLAAQRLSELES